MLRAATRHDAAAIADLLTQLGYTTTPMQASARLATIFGLPDWVTLVAEEQGRLLGFGGLHVSPSYEHDTPIARIVAMVVDAGARRRGVGASIVRALEERAVVLGAGKIVVTSANHRADAHAFYESLGYERTGLRFGRDLKR